MSAASSEVFSGPLGEELARRLEHATGEARELLGLGLPGDSSDATDVVALRELIGALRARLSESDLGAEAVHEQEAALARLRHRFDARFDALERVTAAIAEVREVTSPREMLLRAPGALCARLRVRARDPEPGQGRPDGRRGGVLLRS